jgi:hypothetical protein
MDDDGRVWLESDHEDSELIGHVERDRDFCPIGCDADWEWLENEWRDMCSYLDGIRHETANAYYRAKGW